MSLHIQIARTVTEIAASVAKYKGGLGLKELARFEDHEGFDGAMLGEHESGFHFEFTFCRKHTVAPSPTPEDLLVFYVPEAHAWEARCQAKRSAGFKEVESFNPFT